MTWTVSTFSRAEWKRRSSEENKRQHAKPIRRATGWDDTLPVGCISISAAARHLEVKQNELFAWLSESQWIARNDATNTWTGCDAPIEQGWLAMRRKSIGFQRYVYQVVVTPRGLNELTRRFYGIK
jgi:phage antirepressor YoqD-like protein